MTSEDIAQYRDHSVWADLAATHAEIVALDDEGRTAQIMELDEVVSEVQKRRLAPVPLAVYGETLDAIKSLLPSLALPNIGQPYYQGTWVSSLQSLKANVRQLPPSPSGEISQAMRVALEQQGDATLQKLSVVQQQLNEISENLRETVQDFEIEVARLGADRIEVEGRSQTQLASLSGEIDTARSVIQAVAQEANSRINLEWSQELATWRAKAQDDEQVHDRAFSDELATLVAAARIGQRLVEHAAGTLTALDWTRRATRERRSGRMFRLLAVLSFVSAAVFGLWFISEIIKTSVTFGDGIIRAAVVLAISGLGTYLAAESRRHLHEADTAEEVSTVLQQMEPFLAGSGDRDKVRADVSDTIFVRNVLSRFNQRDSSAKQVSEQDMPQLIAALSDAVQKLAVKSKQ